MAFNPTTNPLFNDQWYLKNTGQRGAPGVDINVTQVWTKYTGRGIIVAVNDDGMDLTHPDLVDNVLTALTFDTASGTTGRGFVNAGNSHGTVVGSIIGMANNGQGGIGIAFDAKLVAGLAIGSNLDASPLFLSNLTSGASVSCNSWGADPAFAENFSASGSASDQQWGAAMLRCVAEARGGLGMVIEVSGGNERANLADSALSNFTSARYTIAVGATDNVGRFTDYSTPGASLLVTAPGGVGSASQSTNSGYGIVSADVASTSGYNTMSGETGNYAYQNQGTSYSGPMVAGVSALMLQANPKLGFRDVSTILAMTARQTDVPNSSWVATSGSSWNLGGMHFSRDYGFGLIDAKAAVHLAESWNVEAGTVANWRSADAVATAHAAVIPENSAALRVTAQMTGNISIERLEVLLELDATAPSQLMATLTSPAGTTVTLFDGPLTRALANGSPDMTQPESAWPGVFSVGVTAFLGEQSAGTWSIGLLDKVTGTTATYKSATVRAWGSDSTPNNNFVFTDEFRGSKTLVDAAGIDTLNAAALTGAVSLNLNADARSTVASGDFLVATGTLIENAIGGDGADTLTGNAGNNLLRGNRGNDSVDGGGGLDTAVFTGAYSNYTLTRASTAFTVTDKNSTEGTDTLLRVERLQFADVKVAIDIDGMGGQAYRLYQAAFNRKPDQGGLGFQINVLDTGVNIAQVAQNFINSPEFSITYGRLNDTQFVTQLYANVLHRAPDAGGLAFHTNNIATGANTRANVLVGFSESPENQAALIGVILNGMVYS